MENSAVVVEDQDDIRGLLTTILESSGYTVHATDNGLDAVELVRSVSPEVMTLDVNIPGIDGFEVARRLREFSDTYIIFISAFVEPGDAERGRAAGGDEYLGKPFRPRDLKARLAGIPSHRRRDAAPALDPLTAASLDRHRTFGDLDLDADRLRVRGDDLAVSPGELAVVRELIAAQGRACPKEDLAVRMRARTRDAAADAEEIRAVERTVEKLRAALESSGSTTRVESRQGVAYRLVVA